MVGILGARVMGKLTALKIRSLAEPGRYADGDGLFLDMTGKAAGRWVFAFSQMGGEGELASDR